MHRALALFAFRGFLFYSQPPTQDTDVAIDSLALLICVFECLVECSHLFLVAISGVHQLCNVLAVVFFAYSSQLVRYIGL